MKKGLALFACGLLAVSMWATNAVAAVAPAATPPPAAAAPASDKPLMPEFGPSLTFDAADPAVRLSDLKGKMVMVVFFQSWCPICNGWSPDLVKQLTATYGDDRSVVLMGIYTDGPAAEGKKYLKSKGADVSKWLVAADVGGSYYQRVSGGNALWGYAIVDADGRMTERGKAGRFYSKPGDKEFVLADAKVKQKHLGASTPVLPPTADYGPELAPVVKMAEAGNFRMAFQGAKNLSANPKVKDNAAKLTADLTGALAKRVTTWTAALTGTDAAAKYDAFRNLRAVSLLSDVEPAKAAKEALAAAKADKGLTKEEVAEAAFWGMVTKSARMTVEQRKTQLGNGMKQFATANKGTVFGDRAAAEAETLANPPAAN